MIECAEAEADNLEKHQVKLRPLAEKIENNLVQVKEHPLKVADKRKLEAEEIVMEKKFRVADDEEEN